MKLIIGLLPSAFLSGTVIISKKFLKDQGIGFENRWMCMNRYKAQAANEPPNI